MSVLIYGLAADKVETQAQHSFSASMKMHQQLLKTDVETANVKIYGYQKTQTQRKG